MTEVEIENGFVKADAGTWLTGRVQPTACRGAAAISGMKGLFVADRAWVRKAVTTATAWFASADAPFLLRLDALPDDPMHLVSSKLLLAPFESRVGAMSLKLVPLSFQRATAITVFKHGWAVASTRSRVTRVALGDGETMTVRPEALVAWTGHRPTGFCPKLGILDMILPRGPRNLMFSFHGPAVVWFEGGCDTTTGPRGSRNRYWGGYCR